MKPIYIILIIVVILVISILIYVKLKPTEKKISNQDQKPLIAKGKKFNGKCFKNPDSYKSEMINYLNSDIGKNSDWGKSIMAKIKIKPDFAKSTIDQNNQLDLAYKNAVNDNIKFFINENWEKAEDCDYKELIL